MNNLEKNKLQDTYNVSIENISTRTYYDENDRSTKVEILVDFGDSFISFTKVLSVAPKDENNKTLTPYDYRIVEYNKFEKLAKLYESQHIRDEEIDDECIKFFESSIYGLSKESVEEPVEGVVAISSVI